MTRSNGASAAYLRAGVHHSVAAAPGDAAAAVVRADDWRERRARLAFAISAAMSEEDLTPATLAARINRSANTVGRWIRGETVPNALELKPLADSLCVRYEFLVDPPAVPLYPLHEFRRPAGHRPTVRGPKASNGHAG